MSITYWIICAVLLYVVVAAGILLDMIRRGVSIYEPEPLFVALLSLYSLPLPVRLIFTRVIEGNISVYLEDFIEFIPVSLVCTAFSLFVFHIFYHMNWGEVVSRYLPTLKISSSTGAGFAGLGVGVVSLVLISLLAGGPQNLVHFVLLGYGGTAKTVGSGHLAIGLPWLFVASMFLMLAYALRPSRWWLCAAILALMSNVGMNFVMGSRSMLLYIAMAVTLFFLISIRKVRWQYIIVLAISSFLFLNVMGISRKSDYSGFDQFLSSTAAGITNSFSNSGSGLFYTVTIGQFVVPFETLPQMIRAAGDTTDFQFGLSYVQSPLYLIPSAVYPGRPLPLSNWYMEEFYGQSGKLNEGRQFFFLAEAYLNFGFLGFIIIPALWGVGWRAWFEWLRRCEYDAGASLVYALGMAYMYRCIGGIFATLVAGFTQQSLFVAVVGLALAGALFKFRWPTKFRWQLYGRT